MYVRGGSGLRCSQRGVGQPRMAHAQAAHVTTWAVTEPGVDGMAELESNFMRDRRNECLGSQRAGQSSCEITEERPGGVWLHGAVASGSAPRARSMFHIH